MEEAHLAEVATLRAEVVARSKAGWDDIRLHMERLFDTVLELKPRLMVELGIRGGVSSFALERGARLVGAKMICVDRNDCSGVLGYAEFVQSDDVDFAATFERFCHDRGIAPIVDFLMIDTLHTFRHTKREVEAWLPHMAPRCIMAFHDTNAKPLYDGVAAYLRHWLRIPFPEQEDFVVESNGWTIEHHMECYGLTLIRRN